MSSSKAPWPNWILFCAVAVPVWFSLVAFSLVYIADYSLSTKLLFGLYCAVALDTAIRWILIIGDMKLQVYRRLTPFGIRLGLQTAITLPLTTILVFATFCITASVYLIPRCFRLYWAARR